MALGLEDKKAIVAEVQEAAKGALSAVVADSRGVSVETMTELRKQAREAGVWLKVVRNTLARRAVEGTDYECLNDSFVGPTLIAFSTEHPGAGARILKDFAKSNDKFELKTAVFEGQVVCCRHVGFSANLRRSYCQADEHYERSCSRQAGPHSGGPSRTERTRSSLILKRFLNRLYELTELPILGIEPCLYLKMIS